MLTPDLFRAWRKFPPVAILCFYGNMWRDHLNFEHQLQLYLLASRKLTTSKKGWSKALISPQETHTVCCLRVAPLGWDLACDQVSQPLKFTDIWPPIACLWTPDLCFASLFWSAVRSEGILWLWREQQRKGPVLRQRGSQLQKLPASQWLVSACPLEKCWPIQRRRGNGWLDIQ